MRKGRFETEQSLGGDKLGLVGFIYAFNIGYPALSTSSSVDVTIRSTSIVTPTLICKVSALAEIQNFIHLIKARCRSTSPALDVSRDNAYIMT